MRRDLWVWLTCVLVACGGAQSPSTTTAGPTAAERAEEAAEAWAALDADRAARAADDAITLGGDEGAREISAREISARAHLAGGRPDAAVRALEGISDAGLLRLRARAQIAQDDFAGAVASLEAARSRAREEDPWTEAMLPALRAADERGAPYVVEGAADVALAELPLPVVEVGVDAQRTLALIGSGTDIAVLDPSVRRAPGAIDELTVGELRVRNVPHIVRSLEDVRAGLGVEIGMVIGAELLVRTDAVLDGPNGRLRTGGAPPDTASRAPARMLTGSFLAIDARLGSAPAWLTVDTAGGFPVAITPGTDEALGIPEAEWQATEAGPALWLAPQVRLGALQIEQIPLVRGLLDESHARAVAAPVAGSVGWGLLSQLVTRFDRGALYFE